MDHDLLVQHYTRLFGSPPNEVLAIAPHASGRKIFRLTGEKRSIIAVTGPDTLENDAFVDFSNHFKKHALPVPEIIHYDREAGLTFQQDLGDITLYDIYLQGKNSGHPFSTSTVALYKESLEQLTRFQITAGKDFDFKRCYPFSDFGTYMAEDVVTRFREKLLQDSGCPFDTDLLQKEFDDLISYLTTVPSHFFLHRDAQSRNIMVTPGGVYFIDYQGGMRGLLSYDVVSLLYQASTELPEELRSSLRDYYLSCVRRLISIDTEEFLASFQGALMIRMIQVLGRYGEQRLGHRKEYIRKSMPGAINTLSEAIDKGSVPLKLSELRKSVSWLRDQLPNLV